METSKITQTITSALGRRAREGVGETYYELKEVFKDKYGPDSNLSQALTNLEQNPDADDLREALNNEIISEGVEDDGLLNDLVRKLMELLWDPPVEVSGTGTVLPIQQMIWEDTDDDW